MVAPLPAAEGPRRPNVVFIVADDLGYGETGIQGSKDIPTPNIDGLAAEGVRFTNGYVTAPFCAASRAALMTGRYQTRFGFEFNPIGAKNAAPGIGLPLGERTVAERLRETGYVTALVGKWHLGGTADFHPMRRGFDEFFGFLHEGHTYVPLPWSGVTSWLRRRALPDNSTGRWTSPDGRVIWSTHLGNNEPDYDADNPLLRGSQPVDEKSNLTDAFTREARDFIRRHATQPFFLYLAYNAVHSPMQGADRYMEKFRHLPDVHRRIFAAMLSHLDDSVGAVLGQLRESNIERDTLVVFISDNGGPTRELTSSNAPLRGEKGQLLEGGIRVPFIVRWPGKFPAGKVSATPVISMDLTATSLAAAGASVSSGAIDGIDLAPVFAKGDAGTAAARTFYWRVGPRQAVRQGDWKLLREPARGGGKAGKATKGEQGGKWQLYNLANDIGEKTDLAAKEPARVAELAEKWDRWNAQQIEPRW